MFSYRSILKQSWKITKNNKKLWIFGFLAFLISAGGEYQILNRLMIEDYGTGLMKKSLHSGMIDSSLIKNIFEVFSMDISLGLALVFLCLLTGFILFILLWVCLRSQISLINWVKKIKDNKKSLKISVWDDINKKGRDTWRVLGLNLLFKFIISLLFLILSLPLVYIFFNDSNTAILVHTLFFIIFLPIAISVSLIIKYAMVAVVLEKKTLVKSIEESVDLFNNNWLVSLEVAILLFLINFLAGLLIMFILAFIMLPIILALIMFGLTAGAYVVIFSSLILMLLSVAILITFQTAVWTNLFLELKESKGLSKLERLAKRKKVSAPKKASKK